MLTYTLTTGFTVHWLLGCSVHTARRCMRVAPVFPHPTALPNITLKNSASTITLQFTCVGLQPEWDNSAPPIRRRRFGAGTFRHRYRWHKHTVFLCISPVKLSPGLRANMNPDSISCDYEIALFNTVSVVFPNAEIFGFFLHFVKNFKKCVNSYTKQTPTSPYKPAWFRLWRLFPFMT